MSLPNVFPKDAAKVLISLATGGSPTTLDVVTAGYDLVGYGLFIGFNGATPLIGDDQETIDLKNQLVSCQPQLTTALPPFLSALIIQAIQALLQRLLTPKA